MTKCTGFLLVTLIDIVLMVFATKNVLGDGDAGSSDIKANLQELREYLNKKIISAKLKVHKHLEMRRVKRKIEDNDILTFANEPNGISPFTSEPYDFPAKISSEGPTCWSVTSIQNESYIVVGTMQRKMYLLGIDFMMTKFEWKVNGIPYHAEVVRYNQKLYIVVAVEDMFSRHWVEVYLHKVKAPKLMQRIQSDGEISMSIAISREFLFLAIGSTYSRVVDDVPCRFTKLSLYLWKNTQFDSVAVVETVPARSIVIWDIKGTLYLAAAQQAETDDQLELVGSPVYYYDYSKRMLVIVQKIWIPEPYAIKIFKVDGNFYMVLAGKSEARIYWWEGRQFIEYQILEESFDAIDVEIFELPNNEIALVIVHKNKITFYLEDSFSRYVISKVWSENRLLLGDILKVKFLRFEENTYLAFLAMKEPLGSAEPNVYKITFVPPIPEHWTDLDPLISCVKSLKNQMNNRRETVRLLSERGDRVFVTNKEQNLTATISVQGSVTVKNNLTITELKVEEILPPRPQNISNETYSKLLSSMKELEGRINQTGNEASNLVYVDSKQIISGKIKFRKPVKANFVSIGHLSRNVTINGINVSSLMENSLRNDGGDTPIFSANKMKFKKLIATNITLKGQLNGLSMDDVLLVNSKETQVINGKWILHEPTFEKGLQIQPGFTLNGMSPENWVTTDSPDQFLGPKTFLNLEVDKNIIVRTTTNGIDLSEESKKIVYIDKPQQVNGAITFNTNITVGKLTIKGKINRKVNVDYLLKNAVNVNGDQEIRGKKTFLRPIHVYQGINIKRLTNDIDLDKQAVTLNTPQNINGIWKFHEVVFSKDLDTGTVNGIDLSEEAVSRCADNVITGSKIFTQTIKSTSNITLAPKSTINGFDFSADFFQNIVIKQTIKIEKAINIVINGNVKTAFEINGIRVNEDLPKKFWSKTKEQVINTTITFLGSINVTCLHANSINNESIENFVRTSKPEIIKAKKFFNGTSTTVTIIKTGFNNTINGIDFKNFNKTAFIHPNVSSIPAIYKTLEVSGDVIVTESVNGHDLSKDVMLSSVQQTVTGTVHLAPPETTVIIGNFKTDSIDVETKVNGVNLSEFLENVVFKDKPLKQPITNKTFAGGLNTFNLNSSGRIDGVNLEEMKTRVVTIDSEQTIVAPKNFTDDLTMKDEMDVGKLNDLGLCRHIHKVIQCDLNECTIKGPKIIMGDVTVKGNLTVKSTINDINIEEMMGKIFYKSKGNQVTAPFTLNNDAYIRELVIEESGTLDGTSPTDVLYLEGDSSTLINKVEFLSDLQVNGDVQIEGKINKCNVEELAREAIVTENANQIISGYKNFSHIKVHGNIIWKGIHEKENMNGGIFFKDGVKANHLIVKNGINGINIPAIFRDAVRKSTNGKQVVKGTKQFISPSGLEVSKKLTCGDLKVKGLINNVLLEKLYNEVVWTSGNQEINGNIIFKDLNLNNLQVKGQINGILLPWSVILLNGSAQISTTTIFENTILIQGDLIVHNDIDGISLSNFLSNRITLSQPEVISADLEFLGDIDVHGMVIKEKVNSIPVEAIVTTTGKSYVLRGHKLFEDGLHIKGKITADLINSVNISILKEYAIEFNGNQMKVAGKTVFEDTVTLKNLMINQMMNGQKFTGDITSIYNQAVSNIFQNLGSALETQENKLENWFASLKEYYMELSHFELIQEVNIFHGIVRIMTSPLFVDDIWPYVTEETDKIDLWTQATCNSCLVSISQCHCGNLSTVSIPLEEDGRWTVKDKSEEQNKRMLPLTFYNDNDGFIMSVDTARVNPSCENIGDGVLEITTVIRSLPTKLHYHKFNISFLTDAKVLSIQDEIYLIAVYSHNNLSDKDGIVIVYKYDQITPWWEEYQRLPTGSAADLDVLDATGNQDDEYRLFLAIVTENKAGDAPSLIYTWDENSLQFELVQSIKSSHASKVQWALINEDIYLLLGSKRIFDPNCKDPHIMLSHGIQIYKQTLTDEGLKFTEYQQIDMKGVNSMAAFKFAGETYIAVASKYEGSTYIMQWMGNNGFRIVDSMSSLQVEDVHMYWSAKQELFMVTAASTGQIKIMKAVIQGHNVSAITESEEEP